MHIESGCMRAVRSTAIACNCLNCITFHSHSHIDRDSNDVDVPVRRNMSYATTLSLSTTSRPQPRVEAVSALASHNDTDTAAVAGYSKIGPSYETIDHDVDTRREQPAVVVGRNRVSARLSERYELSETHMAAGASTSGGGVRTVLGQVPQNLRKLQEHNEDYSHLHH